MDEMKWLELYENIERSCLTIENIRIHLPSKDTQTLVNHKGKDKKYLMDWYKSQERYIDREILAFLDKQDLSKLDPNFGIFTYSLDKPRYDQIKSKSNRLDNFKFLILRNYFSIIRLEKVLSIYSSNNLELKISYRSSETDKEEFCERTLSKSFVDKLQYMEDILLFINCNDFPYKSKMPSYLIPTLLSHIEQLSNLPYEIIDRGPKFGSIKPRGYILNQDKVKYNRIADVTERNMIKFVGNTNLLKHLETITIDYENRKIGA